MAILLTGQENKRNKRCSAANLVPWALEGGSHVASWGLR